jgi:hypothetical protein
VLLMVGCAKLVVAAERRASVTNASELTAEDARRENSARCNESEERSSRHSSLFVTVASQYNVRPGTVPSH